MSDNPTPEEQVVVPTQSELETELEKGMPKPVNQWWIRGPLLLIPLLCFWEWSWFKKAVKKIK